MKLIFSLSRSDLSDKQNEIRQAIAQQYPNAEIVFEVERRQLTVNMADEGDSPKTARAICHALEAVGVAAYPITGGNVPPVEMAAHEPSETHTRQTGVKQKQQVSLSVFVLSLIAVALLVFSLSFLMLGGLEIVLSESTLGTGQQEGEAYADKIAVVDGIFEQYSLYDTDGNLLLDAMLKAYAEATGDRYAMYYTAQEYEDLMKDNAGDFVGIGIMVETDVKGKRLTIVRVIPDSPAQTAGLLPGDEIVYVGSGEEKAAVSEIGSIEANNRLVGEENTVADFVVLRDGVEIPFSVVRESFKTVAVEMSVSKTDPSVGIIDIYEFNTETPVQFKAAMEELAEQGCTKVVFDVRDNPGGDLNSICAVLSYFLEEGDTILSTVQKDGTTTTYPVKVAEYEGDYASCSVSSEEIGMYRSYIGSMTVLTNGYTASAAELFTAALQDYGLARVVGKTTYGKGIIQSIFPLDAWGYEGAVKLTVGYYNPPISENYDGVGITPDLSVSLSEEAEGINLYVLPEEKDAQLLAAIADLIAE